MVHLAFAVRKYNVPCILYELIINTLYTLEHFSGCFGTCISHQIVVVSWKMPMWRVFLVGTLVGLLEVVSGWVLVAE